MSEYVLDADPVERRIIATIGAGIQRGYDNDEILEDVVDRYGDDDHVMDRYDDRDQLRLDVAAVIAKMSDKEREELLEEL